MKKKIIGVMGPGKEATKNDCEVAETIGSLIAENNWVTLSGGMDNGVMKHVNIGAKKKNGLTLGILPTDDTSKHSKNLDIPIITNMKGGRNYINILSSDLILVIGMSSGTASETSFAVNLNKPIIMLNNNEISINFFKSLNKTLIYVVNSPEEAIKIMRNII